MKKQTLILLAGLFSLCLSGQNNKEATITALRNEVISLVKLNEDLRMEISILKSALLEREVYVNNLDVEKQKAINEPKKVPTKSGEEYKIQLGVQNSSIESLNNPKILSGSKINGKMVYNIEGFQNPSDAYSLSLDIRKLNLSGAFVTRYVDGVRDYTYKYDASKATKTKESQTYYVPGKNESIFYDSESGSTNNPNIKKSKSLVIEE